MNDKMMKMLMSKKKQGKEVSGPDQKSKLEALKGMKGMADSMMGDKLKNLKKVTVASNSPEGIKAGLHKAEDLVDQPGHFSEGGNVYDHGDKGGHVAGMPEKFNTDLENAKNEDSEMSPSGQSTLAHGYDQGGSPEDEESSEHEASESPEFEAGENEESVEKILEDSPNDPDELDELIKKLEEKKRSLQQ